MIGGPISITIGATTHVLNQISMPSGKNLESVYRDATSSVTLTVSHQITGKQRVRSTVRLDWKKVVTDPITEANDFDSVTRTQTFDRPVYGFSLEDVQDMESGAQAWLTDGIIAKLFGQES